jgi:7,8-dihydroneopterin aldolase/epimerase/oxygenase
MGKIILEDMEFHAFHGYYPEEQKTGGRFLVNIEMDTAFEDACASDKLEDTFDYVTAYEIVKAEMQKQSALIEHVAGRIIDCIFGASKLVWAVKIKISKMDPGLGGKVKAATVEISRERIR